MWRNQEIKTRLKDVREYLGKVNAESSPFNAERRMRLKYEQVIHRHESKITELETEVDKLRSQLAYAAAKAVEKNCDPNEFFISPELLKLKIS